MAFPPIYNTKEMADHVRESFVWRWRRASRPPRPLLEDFHALCPRFSLPEAEDAVADFELPEMVQATFFAMLSNMTVELGVVRGFMAEGLKSALVGLRWSSFEVWMSCVNHELKEAQLRRHAVTVEVRGPLTVKKRALDQTAPRPLLVTRSSLSCRSYVASSPAPQATKYVHDHFRWSLRDLTGPGPTLLPSDYHNLCPRFDLKVARRYAHDSHIPKMVLVIFYAMVIDYAAELGLSRRLTMDVVMWAMRKLGWGLVQAWLGDNCQRLRTAQASHPADSSTNPVLVGGPSRGRTFSFPSFRGTVQAAKYIRDNERETSSLRPNLLP
ncbi:hypothetical protein Cgig2_018570 [Carnegiea gigantea]|uniref:Uncharacterized protein n=1 Tax=Carnegiea gigantea TaxID=171969 RepID=A0A9Q1KMP6_9CARY|nr:hypothetical protein Cgig2_018570 [Carnegiea gigantea]